MRIKDSVEPDSTARYNSHKNSNEKSLLSLDFALDIMAIASSIGVVFSFMGSLSLDGYHFYFTKHSHCLKNE